MRDFRCRPKRLASSFCQKERIKVRDCTRSGLGADAGYGDYSLRNRKFTIAITLIDLLNVMNP
jgi:hypothetical protein